MNILIISSPSPYRTSGVVAYDLYKGLSRFDGNHVKLLVKYCESKDENVISFLTTTKYYLEWIDKKWNSLLKKLKIIKKGKIKLNPDYHVQDVDQTITYYSTKRILKRVNFVPNAVIVLFTQNFLSFKNIYEIQKYTGSKIYMYPMDMSQFTGGCHYALDCKGYQENCGNCPALYSSHSVDKTKLNLDFKKEYAQLMNLNIFACNHQIYKQINSSSIFRNIKTLDEVFPVPDTEIFFKTDKAKSKEYFSIGSTKKVIFFGSVALTEKRKGMGILYESLKITHERLVKEQYDLSSILFLIAGSNFESAVQNVQFDHKYIGFIDNYNLLSTAFNASNFFISPSVEDTGPTMVLQSILCLTPVISFDIGYANNLLRQNTPNIIALEKNALSLAECIYNSIVMTDVEYNHTLEILEKVRLSISDDSVLKRINNEISQ